MPASQRLLAIVFLCAAAWACAQSLSSVRGVVLDPSGAAVPHASLTLTNPSTGANRTTLSDSAGRYAFLQVQPGTYQIAATAPGFNPVTVKHVVLLVDSPSTVEVAFVRVGGAAQSVSVTADTTQINTTDASIGNAIGAHAIMQLPLEARSVVGLLSLQPGVTWLGDVEPGDENDYRSGAVNGGKNDQGNVTLDGIDVNNQQSRDAFTSVLRVTPDSVDEFRVTTTNGGAESGRTSGAQVALITKSGTNQFHGSLYDYLRNTATSANDFLSNAAGVPRAKLNRNLFGGTLGGPVKKDRLFFFVNYEGRQDRSESSQIRVVPNATFRQGAFNYLTKSGAIATLSPAQIVQLDPLHKGADPAILQLFQSFPLPNDTTVGDNLNTGGYRFNASTPSHLNDYIARLDYKIDSAGKHTLFWRGSLQDDHIFNGAPEFPGDPASSAYLDHSKGFAVGYTALLRPNLVSTFHYGLTREGIGITGDQTAGAISLSNIDDRHALTDPLTVIIPTHMFSEDVAWSKGAHTVTFGASARIIRNRRDNYQNAYSFAFA
ncbi:MAG: carboxypeptidase-like regulatory domain-containing protein, partial [Acidobacteriaceae bacterium]